MQAGRKTCCIPLLLLVAVSCAAAASGKASGNPLWAVPLEALAETRERPLFSATRRPPPVAMASPARPALPPAQNAQEPPPLRLMGTILGGPRAIAVLTEEPTGRVVRLRAGEQHGGWRLSRIGRREVTLARNGTTAALALVGGTAVPGLPLEPERPAANTAFAELMPPTSAARCLAAAPGQPGWNAACVLGQGRTAAMRRPAR